jgi:hypothetical protein
MVEEMAGQASMTVEQAVLFTAAQLRGGDRRGYDSTPKVLSAALDTKDQNTHGHPMRGAADCDARARDGCPERALVDMERARCSTTWARSASDDVLRARAELNDHEWEAMQSTATGRPDGLQGHF